MAYTDTWDAAFEAVPADVDDLSDGAGDIRDLKLAIRERLEKDHYFDEAGTDADHGEHTSVTLRVRAAPTHAADKGILYTKDVSSKAELFYIDEDGDEVQLTTGGALAGASLAGEVKAVAFSTVPSGWLECNGAAVSRTTYATLFAAISTEWGTGDGSTTFNLPDFRGRFLRGWDHAAARDPDRAARTASNTGGATGDNVGSVQADELKAHTHTQAGLITAGGGVMNSLSDRNGADTPVASSSAGGNETRPINANVMYIIKT